MNNDILVSVIIPVFNVRPFIFESLNSVINQTYNNLEIIIDDGSYDGSENECDLLAKSDNRIHVIHQQHKGLSAARNAGLDIVRGSIVAFLDPDDKYLPNFIDSLLSEMIINDVDVVVCKNITLRTNGEMAFDSRKTCT